MTSKQKLSGADIFFECLKLEKVEYIFGYPGGATLKIYEKLYDVKFLQHILSFMSNRGGVKTASLVVHRFG